MEEKEAIEVQEKVLPPRFKDCNKEKVAIEAHNGVKATPLRSLKSKSRLWRSVR